MKIIEFIKTLEECAKSAEGITYILPCDYHLKPFTRIVHEYRYTDLNRTLRDLSKGGTDREMDQACVELLENLLIKCNYIVRKTPLQGIYCPHAPLTTAYLMIAQCLESMTGKSRYQYLFPTLNIVEYEASSMTLNDHDLQLTDFVLSDDETSVIELMACLDFAVEDGVLKHTRLFNGQMKALSCAEANSVINHTQETQAYWAAIQAKLDIELRGESFGAVLKRLSNMLSKGGSHGGHGGDERNAGADANVGIQEFFVWFNALENDEKNIIRSATAPGLSYTLGNLLDRLATPNAIDLNDTRFCIEIISGNIDLILVSGRALSQPKLFDIHPKNKVAVPSVRIDEARDRVKQARAVLKHALSSGSYRPALVSVFRPDFVNTVLSVVSIDDFLELTVKISPEQLAMVLKNVHKDKRMKFILRLTQELILNILNQADDEFYSELKVEVASDLYGMFKGDDSFYKNLLTKADFLNSQNRGNELITEIRNKLYQIYSNPDEFALLLLKVGRLSYSTSTGNVSLKGEKQFDELLTTIQSIEFSMRENNCIDGSIFNDNHILDIMMQLQSKGGCGAAARFLYKMNNLILYKDAFKQLMKEKLPYRWEEISTLMDVLKRKDQAIVSDDPVARYAQGRFFSGQHDHYGMRALEFIRLHYRFISDAVESLGSYGLTEDFLRANATLDAYVVPPIYFHDGYVAIMKYLVTGIPNGPALFGREPMLAECQRLTPEQAFHEVHGLGVGSDKLSVLRALYGHGLRRSHLNGMEYFTNAHRCALEFLMIDCNPRCSAEDAVSQIINLSHQEVEALYYRRSAFLTGGRR